MIESEKDMTVKNIREAYCKKLNKVDVSSKRKLDGVISKVEDDFAKRKITIYTYCCALDQLGKNYRNINEVMDSVDEAFDIRSM